MMMMMWSNLWVISKNDHIDFHWLFWITWKSKSKSKSKIYNI